MPSFFIRPIEDSDRSQIAKLVEELWGSHLVVTRGAGS
jgi:hypothetical protein